MIWYIKIYQVMKTILVHASISQIGFNSFGVGDEGSWINHGLCSISAYAKNKGYTISLIDLRKIKDWVDFKKEIINHKPDVVGLTMMSPDYNYVMKCISIIKDVNQNIKTVVGGPHPSIMLDEVSKNNKIDYIIVGEGEISFTDLLSNIKKNVSSPRIIQGIMPDLEEIPFADRELYGQHETPIIDDLPSPFVTIIAGRGCIYNCSFCQPAERKIFGEKVRRRSVENVLKELNILREKYSFKSMMIHDDCLTEDKNWVSEFCEKYKANGFTEPFVCQARANHIVRNKDMIIKMKDAGLKMLIIGFESGSQRVLNFLRKGTTVEQNYEAAKICKELGILIWANYMMGIPTETKEEVMQTVKMIRDIKSHHYSPAFFTPHPGSDLFEYCEKNNLSLIKDPSDYRRSPGKPKIKGIDYKFLNKALLLSTGQRSGIISTVARRLISIKLIHNIKDSLKKFPSGRKIINIFKKLIYGTN